MDLGAVGWTVASLVALIGAILASGSELARDGDFAILAHGATAASLGSLLVSVFYLKEVLPGRLQRFDDEAFGHARPRGAVVSRSEAVFANGRPTLQLELLVPHQSGTSYPVAVTAFRDGRREQLATPGSEVVVRVHPGDPQRLRVDWELTSASAPALPNALAVVSLRCTSCGADLTVGNRSVVVCQYCHTENHVVRA